MAIYSVKKDGKLHINVLSVGPLWSPHVIRKSNLPGKRASHMRVLVDRKKRVRVSMSLDEARQVLGIGEKFKLHAIEEDHGWVTWKHDPSVSIGSSAPVPGMPRWVRTSFRDDREQHSRALVLAKSLGLTYCQWLRMLEAHELEKFGYVDARRRRPDYVG
jgi:hypothetical protein